MFRLSQNGTNPGLYQIKFRSQNVLKFYLIKSWICPILGQSDPLCAQMWHPVTCVSPAWLVWRYWCRTAQLPCSGCVHVWRVRQLQQLCHRVQLRIKNSQFAHRAGCGRNGEQVEGNGGETDLLLSHCTTLCIMKSMKNNDFTIVLQNISFILIIFIESF